MDRYCKYGFCDGSGAVCWEQTVLGISQNYPYEYAHVCPCRYDKMAEIAGTNGNQKAVEKAKENRQKSLEWVAKFYKGEQDLKGEFVRMITPSPKGQKLMQWQEEDLPF